MLWHLSKHFMYIKRTFGTNADHSVWKSVKKFQRFLGKIFCLLCTCFDVHTIRKVKFLSKNSILTKPQHFPEFFIQICWVLRLIKFLLDSIYDFCHQNIQSFYLLQPTNLSTPLGNQTDVFSLMILYRVPFEQLNIPGFYSSKFQSTKDVRYIISIRWTL